MRRYIAKRVAHSLFIMWLVATSVFFGLRAIPGGPVRAMLGQEGTPEARRAIREQLGLNDPWYVQYADWMTDLLVGEFGSSITSSEPVAAVVGQAAPKTFSIGIVAVSIGVAFAFAGYGNILTALATVAAAATLAIGFAMQDVIANFVAGVFIYTDKPFRIGDWIEWDGNSGVVEDISLRVSRVRTFDNELLTVPNSNLTDGVIKNPVAKDKLRVQFEFGIGYDDDIDKATEIIVEEAEKRDDIMDDPGVSVRLSELGGSYVGLKSRFWIADPSRADFVKTRGEYVQSVKERFDAEGVNIPYPTRTLEGGLTIEGEAISPEAFDSDD